MKNSPSILRMKVFQIVDLFQRKLPIRVLTLAMTALIFALLTPSTIRMVLAGGQSSPSAAAHDPGVRTDAVDAGQPLANLAQTTGATEFFTNGQTRFEEVEVVHGGVNNGLGPRFNSNQCSSCHSQPGVGGSSPAASLFPFVGPNPETLVANLDGATNTLPSFITADGPVREARFVHFLNPNGTVSSTADGGVHDLFTIQGRSDAVGCTLAQPAFAKNVALENVTFRIPTPIFGGGLIENIPEEAILSNMQQSALQKRGLGISGHPNRSGNDGTITRFGWKAQNKSLEMFAGEAYNVEMGITNELFSNERPSPDEELSSGLPAGCKFNPTPEDATNFLVAANSDLAAEYAQVPSDIVQFAMFMRLLSPPLTSATGIPGNPSATSISNGSQDFVNVGCALCHTRTLTTGTSNIAALSRVKANLFSDLLVHSMGTNLADGVTQGAAGPNQFRTAPLWGLGQRIFFLHDGRTSDLLDAIQEHSSSGSEANGVIANFNKLTAQQQQDLLNFLRSL
ncbi:MAG TPA: di-heme oxidoredictase family protein [Silvibacterium sp.]|nr:di-heme oxidoredictase family protein [Silvibacterium sp.]